MSSNEQTPYHTADEGRYKLPPHYVHTVGSIGVVYGRLCT